MDDFMNQSAPGSEETAPAVAEGPKGKPKTFQCPACGGTITIKAVGITVDAVCSSCSSVIDVTNENYQIIKKADKKTRKTLLEIGMRGKLKGIEWEVVGYTLKTDESGVYSWEEYLLYNPYYGFSFLVQASGHWNYVRMLKQDVPGAYFGDKIWLGDTKYSVFLKGESVVDYVKGEFYWRVKKGDRAVVADYIAPPFMLSMERNSEEIIASLGEYIEAEDVMDSFNIEGDIPLQSGVAPNEPAPFQDSFRNIWLVCAIAVGMIMYFQYITSVTAANAEVLTVNRVVEFSEKDQTLNISSFTLPKTGNVLIQSSAPVDNDWVELGFSLVNEQTGDEYCVRQAIEYYHGYDGGEYWAEGGQRAETFISRVPEGNYKLLVDEDAGAFQKGLGSSFTVRVMRDVPSWSNFWITFLLIIIYPLYVTAVRYRFEYRRWEESDFAPSIYKPGEGSDDE